MDQHRQRIDLNGIRAKGGAYALSLSPAQVTDLALGSRLDQAALNELLRKKRGTTRSFDLDIRDLSKAGWGVIFPASLDAGQLQERQDALAELVRHRQEAAGPRFKIFSGRNGYIPGETKRDWLIRVGASPDGVPNPDKVPYYLLLAASPQEIPFAFQYQLDVQYLTGRIHFEQLTDFASYAQGVTSMEKRGLVRPRRVGVFAPANPDDENTHLSHDRLARPLAEYLQSRFRPQMLKARLEQLITQKGLRYMLEGRAYAEAELLQIGEKFKLPLAQTDIPAWDVQTALGSQATRARLEDWLGGPQTPTLLFSASHGMVFDADDPRQRQQQGALLCQDWEGPLFHQGDVTDKLYFAGDHLSAQAQPQGMLAFFFACYGAGTPQYDEFIFDQQKPLQIARGDFLAALPQRMLAHPNGGALAVIGHVDRAWSFSFLADNNQPQLNVFEDLLGKLLMGYPVGAAMDAFNRRYAELATDITDIQNKIRIPGYRLDEYLLGDLWLTHNDARNYMILGDPAVRLPDTAQPPIQTERLGELHSAPPPTTATKSLVLDAALAQFLRQVLDANLLTPSEMNNSPKVELVRPSENPAPDEVAPAVGSLVYLTISLPEGASIKIPVPLSPELYIVCQEIFRKANL